MDNARLLEVLRQENELLRGRIALLEDALIGVRVLPLEWRLTAQEARIFGVLVNRELATKDAIMAGLYGDRADDEVLPKIVDVFVCKLRKKLMPYGIAIETVWGRRGYALAKRDRDAYRKVAA